MPKFLKYALVVLLVVVLSVGAAVALLPDRFEVHREITIDAGPAAIHPYLEDLSRWPEWSAWNAERFPSLVSEFSGPERGVDAVWSWTMDEGPGRLVLTASDPVKGVWYDLTFGEGAERMSSKGAIQYLPAEGGTKLLWTTSGELHGLGKLMGPLVDSAMGPDFEAGLAKLKQLVEGTDA